jgi:hypothetical protein
LRNAGRAVSSLSLVRYRGNDYPVPTAYGHREVLVRGYVHEVVIACGAAEIAHHPRSNEREDFVLDPLRNSGRVGTSNESRSACPPNSATDRLSP